MKMMENNGQSDRALFEVNPIELGRFDPDSQDLDFILYQLIWIYQIHWIYQIQNIVNISSGKLSLNQCDRTLSGLYITITLKVQIHNRV